MLCPKRQLGVEVCHQHCKNRCGRPDALEKLGKVPGLEGLYHTHPLDCIAEQTIKALTLVALHVNFHGVGFVSFLT